MGELGAEGGEMTGDAERRNRASGLDGDVVAALGEFVGEFVDSLGDHRFTTGEHDVADGCFVHEGEDFGEGHFRAGGVPRGVGGIAPRAAEVAARGANEKAGHADQ